MPNGFPEVDFRIINQDTDARLFARYGGQWYGQQEARDRLTGEKGSIEYSHTNDPIFMVGSPEAGGKDDDLWYFRAATDPWGRPDNYLMTHYEDIRSKFALLDRDYKLSLYGSGREGVTKWQTSDGYIFPEGKPDKVITLIDKTTAVMADRGAPNQRWRFEPKS